MPWNVLPLIDREAPLPALLDGWLVMPLNAPLVATLYVTAPAAALPIWLLSMLTAPVTAATFDMAVNPPVVAVEVFPRKMLLEMFRMSKPPVLKMPPRTLLEAAPLIAQFRMVLSVMFTVTVGAAATDVRSIARKVPDVCAL